MYADDLVLVSHSVCVLQKMIDICVDVLNYIGLSFNVKKRCLLRLGPRYLRVCEPITSYNNKLTYVHKARYLGVTLCSGICFGVDLRSVKYNFYSSFNSIFHSAAIVIRMNLLSCIFSICLLQAIYGSECMDVNVTQIRSIEHTWQIVTSHIFHIKGVDVRNVCNYFTDVPIRNRRLRFISGLCYVNNSSLQFIFNVTAN